MEMGGGSAGLLGVWTGLVGGGGGLGPVGPAAVDEVQPEAVAAAPPEPEQGILAFREKLASFKEARVSDRIGLQPAVASADETAAGRPERSMLTSNAPGSSGGINLPEMRARMKILDRLDAAKDGAVVLEDAEHDKLKKLLREFPFGVVHPELVKIADAIENANEAAPK